ncbi:MAG: hypothetical protein P0Y59_00075 [Candidatus Sphingomonas phytovorans]|nr:hypothetical protein [Sphingomonas sp.]WEK00135.1 MAG: hypothetical protein P0Y59_00075 [Sphingomonas sp.]
MCETFIIISLSNGRSPSPGRANIIQLTKRTSFLLSDSDFAVWLLHQRAQTRCEWETDMTASMAREWQADVAWERGS